jgi:arabinogalactan oligomer/maltooligosaccharide transport system permease protein
VVFIAVPRSAGINIAIIVSSILALAVGFVGTYVNGKAREVLPPGQAGRKTTEVAGPLGWVGFGLSAWVLLYVLSTLAPQTGVRLLIGLGEVGQTLLLILMGAILIAALTYLVLGVVFGHPRWAQLVAIFHFVSAAVGIVAGALALINVLFIVYGLAPLHLDVSSLEGNELTFGLIALLYGVLHAAAGLLILLKVSWARAPSAIANLLGVVAAAYLVITALGQQAWLILVVALLAFLLGLLWLSAILPPGKTRHALPFVLLSPAIVGLCLLVVYPMGYEIRLAFSNMSLKHFKETLVLTVGPDAAPGLASELDNRTISDSLRAQFSTNGVGLSTDAVVEVNRAGSNWTIVSSEERYSARIENQALNVYKGPTYSLAEGLRNFADVFNQPVLKQVYFFPLFLRTVLWTAVQVPFHVLGGLVLALLLNRPMKLRGLYRALLVIPWALPPIVAVLAWRGEFHYEYGFINIMLRALGLAAVQWKSDPTANFIAMNIVNIWLGIPFMMVILLGGLQSIPGELYEAAEIDGATWWQQFRRITWPLLQPVLTPAIILGVIWTFNNFNVPFFINENELESSDILVTALFRAAFQYNQYGFAAAFAFVIFAILLVFSIFYINATGALRGVTESAPAPRRRFKLSLRRGGEKGGSEK